MKNNNVNNWNSFSRGLCVALLTIAAFCGICGLGAAFSQVPWLLIAGGVCLLLIIEIAVWFLGFMSRKTNKEEASDPEIITFEKVENADCTYRVHRRNRMFDYDEGKEVNIPGTIIDAEQ